MSLTSHLALPLDPVSVWMRTHFPMRNRRFLVKCLYQSELGEASYPLSLPRRSEAKPATYPYPLIGTALDYRLRLYFHSTLVETAAHRGASLVTRQFARELALNASPLKTPKAAKNLNGTTAPEQAFLTFPVPTNPVVEFFFDLNLLLERLQPAGRVLDVVDEELLCRYCIGLGLFEQIVRAGPWINSPLLVPRPKASVQSILDLATSEMVEDLRQLSSLFLSTCKDLIGLGSKIVPNPTFSGSSLVGGADADFIAGNCLWEVKCSIDVRSSGQLKIQGDWIYQLLGYVLLDFDDEHHIREIGIYLARRGARLQWPLQELLNALMGIHEHEAPRLEERLVQLRHDFQTFLKEDWNEIAPYLDDNV